MIGSGSGDCNISRVIEGMRVAFVHPDLGIGTNEDLFIPELI